MSARIHILSYQLRGIPEGLSPIQTKRFEIQHSLELMTSLFRGIGLMSFEQTGLHQNPNKMDAFTRIEELDRSIELLGEIGAAFSSAACVAVEELVELLPERSDNA